MLIFRSEQFAAMRKKTVGDGLIKTFSGSLQSASREPDSGAILVTDPKGHTIRCDFDDHGFIGKVVGPLGRTYLLENDQNGRMVGLTIPSGLRLGLSRDSEGRINSVDRGMHKLFDLVYDEATQRLGSLAFPDQTKWEFRYVTATELASFTDRLGGTTVFEYDNERRLRAIVDPNGNRTEVVLGEDNRPSRVRCADGNTESYDYDSMGRVCRIRRNSELFADVDYDNGNRPVRVVFGDGEWLLFTYNDEGKVVKAVSAEATVEYECTILMANSLRRVSTDGLFSIIMTNVGH